MTVVTLKIVADGDSLLKIVWGEAGSAPLWFDPYFVHRNQLKDRVRACRDVLRELVSAYIDRDFASYDILLPRLARSGSDLHYLLFAGAAENAYCATTIATWLSNLEGPTRLVISSDASIHVPWGMVFSGPDAASSFRGSDIADYGEFWSLKYQLTVLYSGMSPKPWRNPRPRESFKTLSIVDNEVLQEARNDLNEAERGLLEECLELPEGSAKTIEECKQKWELMKNSDCLLHFFAHASGISIFLSENDQLSIVDLRRKFLDPRRKNQSRIPESLFLLNGCDTAVGDLDNSFLTATAEAGCCGFVGSEADLPTRFAIRFGIALLRLLLDSEMSAVEALDKLRRQHWPLGLLYSCYSHPDFRIKRGKSLTDQPLDERTNFSYLQ